MQILGGHSGNGRRELSQLHCTGPSSPLENPGGSKIWAAGLESTVTCLEDPAAALVGPIGSCQADQLSSYCHSALPEPVHLWGRGDSWSMEWCRDLGPA